ncbi:MAG: SGNH/GDSL hydrolase family protein [Candidatus Hydrogenedentes bacterium]|nr:SGNH/GDSL hydrolase family protein [Candidatus Hydrogenedentota bacterium]
MSTVRAEPESPPAGAERAAAHPTEKARAVFTAVRNGLIVIALSFAILELILRILGVANPVLYERNPDLGYRIKPNQKSSFIGNPIVINSFGVRDARPLDTRDPAKQRVVCLGDSVTWGGIYVRQDELFTSIAERKLGNTEVINAGVNGYSTTQMARLYERYLTGLNPDLVVFCVIPRDFERPPVAQLTSEDVGFPEQPPSSAFVESVQIARIAAARRFDLDWLRPPRQQWRIDEYYGSPERANVTAIVEFAEALRGTTRTLVALLPSNMSRIRYEAMRDHVSDFRAANVPFVDLSRDVIFHDSDFVDGIHLSPDGHRKVGAALAVAIYDSTAPETLAAVEQVGQAPDAERESAAPRSRMRGSSRRDGPGGGGRR